MLALAQIRFALLGFDEAKRLAEAVLEREEDPAAYSLLSELADREGDYQAADGFARRANQIDPDDYPLPFHMSEEEFQECADQALDGLPQRFKEVMRDQLTLIIEPHPSVEILREEDPPMDPTILGLYTGIPLPEREPSQLSGVLPDHIHLFQRNIERAAADRETLISEITVTLYHEIGHFLGLDEDDLEELELD
jgi:predicted Zn-dependent protease with MMP-like domain